MKLKKNLKRKEKENGCALAREMNGLKCNLIFSLNRNRYD